MPMHIPIRYYDLTVTPPVRSHEKDYLHDVRMDRLTAHKPLRVTPDESERLFSRTPSPS